MPSLSAIDQIGSIQAAIIGNSVVYKKNNVDSTIRELEREVRQGHRTKSPKATPVQLQAMGIRVEKVPRA